MKQLHIVPMRGATGFIPTEDMQVIFVGKFFAAYWV